MKFSGSLLQNPDFGKRIFENSIQKVNTLLTSVFGLNFASSGDSIKSVAKDEKGYKYTVTFAMSGHSVNAEFEYEVEDLANDILSEVLTIVENDIKYTKFDKPCSNSLPEKNRFQSCINTIQMILEESYELEFTPLLPEEKDPHILSTSCNLDDLSWNAVFVQDHHEGSFAVKYKYEDKPTEEFETTILRRHKIILD